MKLPVNGCDIVGVKKVLFDQYNLIKNDPVLSHYGNADNMFIKIVEAETGVRLEEIPHVGLSTSERAAIDKKITLIRKMVQRGELQGKIAEWLSTGSMVADKNPTLKGMMSELIMINQEFKGRATTAHNSFMAILDNLRKEMVTRGHSRSLVEEKAKGILGKSAKDKADQVEKKILQAQADKVNGVPGSEQQLLELKKREEKFYQQEEGAVYGDMIHHIESNLGEMAITMKGKNPDWSNSRIQAELRAAIPYFKNQDGTIISGNMVKSVTEYMTMMDTAYRTLTNGMRKFKESVLEGMRPHASEVDIDAFKQVLDEKLKVQKVEGYFPHYVRDEHVMFMQGLAPHLEAINQASTLRLVGDARGETSNAIKDALNYMQSVDAGYMSGHAKRRSDGTQYSQNFLNVLKAYTDEVNRFNFISWSNEATRRAVNEVKTLWSKGKDLNGYGTSLVEFIKDIHAAQTGAREIKNPQIQAMMRTVLGMEFVSKLGWNMRSGLKNITQSALNWVEFGFQGNRHANRYIRELPENRYNPKGERSSWGSRSALNDEMASHGILFQETTPELEEMGGLVGASHKILQWREGKLTFIEPSGVEKMAGHVSKLAAWSGVFMRKAENFNRTRTYKTAFAQMHSRLTANGDYQRALRDGGITGKKLSQEQVEERLWEMSNEYARNMVITLHFDYNDISKAKVLRTDVGRFIGQFQHYAFKFFEYNMNLAKGTTAEVKNLELGPNAWKAFRMSLIYFTAPLLAEAVFGVELGNMLEHDTAQRIKQAAALMTGDEERIKEATYGRGLTGVVGGPVISDMLRVGNLLGFIEMPEESLLRFFTGYQELAQESGDKRLAEFTRIFSTAGARTFYTTLPIAIDGNLGRAAQLEVGLHSTKEARKKQDTVYDLMGLQGDKELVKSLDQIQRLYHRIG